MDRQLRPLIKSTLYLPTNTSTEAPKTVDSASKWLQKTDIFLVDTAFKQLTSKDPASKVLAENDCAKVAAQ
jgi:hypothetical protein